MNIIIETYMSAYLHLIHNLHFIIWRRGNTFIHFKICSNKKIKKIYKASKLMVSKSFYSYVHTNERKRIVFVSLLDSPFENMNKMQGTHNEKSELITTDQLLD